MSDVCKALGKRQPCVLISFIWGPASALQDLPGDPGGFPHSTPPKRNQAKSIFLSNNTKTFVLQAGSDIRADTFRKRFGVREAVPSGCSFKAISLTQKNKYSHFPLPPPSCPFSPLPFLSLSCLSPRSYLAPYLCPLSFLSHLLKCPALPYIVLVLV